MLTNLVLENNPMVRKVHKSTFFLKQYFPNAVAYDLCCRLLGETNLESCIYTVQSLTVLHMGNRPPSYSPSFCVNRVA